MIKAFIFGLTWRGLRKLGQAGIVLFLGNVLTPSAAWAQYQCYVTWRCTVAQCAQVMGGRWSGRNGPFNVASPAQCQQQLGGQTFATCRCTPIATPPVANPTNNNNAANDAEERRQAELLRQQQEEADKQAEFKRQRDEAASTLRGGDSGSLDPNALREPSGTNGGTAGDGIRDVGPAPVESGSSSTLDALTGLAKSGRAAADADNAIVAKVKAECGFGSPTCAPQGHIPIPRGALTPRTAALLARVPEALRTIPEIYQALEKFQTADQDRVHKEREVLELQKKLAGSPGGSEAIKKRDELNKDLLRDRQEEQTAKEDLKSRLHDRGVAWPGEAPPAPAKP